MAWKLLIIDDNEDLAASLAEIFASRGYKVSRARNGREAIDAALQDGFRPDAILLDLVMPIMDGEEFLRARGVQPLLASSPIIVLTSHPGMVARLPGPVFASVRKPADLRQLIDAVHRACHESPPASPVCAA